MKYFVLLILGVSCCNPVGKRAIITYHSQTYEVFCKESYIHECGISLYGCNNGENYECLTNVQVWEIDN